MSLLLPYTLMSLVLDFSQMVLAVWKHLKMAIVIILNNSEQPKLMHFFFSKNSLSVEVLALALHLGAFGNGLQPDGPECLEAGGR